jgi:hypothetical protein
MNQATSRIGTYRSLVILLVILSILDVYIVTFICCTFETNPTDKKFVICEYLLQIEDHLAKISVSLLVAVVSYSGIDLKIYLLTHFYTYNYTLLAQKVRFNN